MAQFLRPDSDITTTGFNTSTGATFYTLLDEATRSDTDYAYSSNNTNATLEVGLSNPLASPDTGTCTLRFTWVKTNNGSLNGTGSDPPFSISVYEGAVLIASVSDATLSYSGSWQESSLTFSTTLVSDFTDIRVRYEVSSTGGNPNNRRGMGFSWVELEIPDGAVTRYILIT